MIKIIHCKDGILVYNGESIHIYREYEERWYPKTTLRDAEELVLKEE